jgi:hypothetical protein
MKAVSIHLPDPVYARVEEYARTHNRSTEQVIVEVVEQWRPGQRRPTHDNRGASLLSLPPLDLGPMQNVEDEDLLGEMLDDPRS